MKALSKEELEQIMGLIADIKPNTLLVLSDALHEHLNAAKPDCALEYLDVTSVDIDKLSKRLHTLVHGVDMVLIAGDIETLESAHASQIIGLLRNVLNAQIVAVFSDSSTLQFNEMIGLGFKRESRTENGMAIYTYDIANYNKKRDWNNARFWANPENFDKFRW